jgi:hypothetical protein
MVNGPHYNSVPSSNSISVQMPSGTTIQSTHQALLNIPQLPEAARVCHLFPALSSGSLLSIGQLCDHGCTAIFTSTKVEILLHNQAILVGTRSPHNRLWVINLKVPSSPSSSNHVALSATATLADRISFYHASLFSPAISTWCTAIDAGRFATFPDLTSSQVRKHLPFSVPMIKGHMDQQRANLRSTQPTPKPIDTTATIKEETDYDINPTAIPDHQLAPARSHFIYADCQQTTGQLFTDPTGRFLTTSTSGNAYILVVYDYDSNYIHAEPMKNRTGPEILAAYQRAITMLASRGLRPLLQRLDNEASAALQQYMQEQQVDYQLAPPNIHRRNAAERAIRTFKNHFIAGLCSTDRNFPLNLWDKLIPQALITLNLLRGSRINPALSAQAQVHGAFDYNRTPLAPPGIRVLVHEKPTIRGTWAPHAVDGWYLGPAMAHYRCYRVWIWETTSERIADTLAWFPTKVVMPIASSAERAAAAAHDLIQALLHPSPASPLAPLSNDHHQALTQLANIFQNATSPTPEAAPLPRVPTLPTSIPTLPPTLPQIVSGPPPGFPPIPPESLTNAPTPSAPVAAPLPTTYAQHTVNQGKRRRAAKRAAAVNRTATTTVLPAPTIPCAPPTAAIQHQHNTRYRTGGRIATFNSANALTQRIPTTTDIPATTTSPPSPIATAFWNAINAVVDPLTGASLEYSQLRKGPDGKEWTASASNEIGRLAQGVMPHMPNGTNTMHFIPPSRLPVGRKATYLRIVASHRPLKKESKRIRFTVGGNLINYPGKVSTPTADLTTVKCLINSVVSTPSAKFMTADIRDFYLNNDMERFEYMWIPIRDIPANIVEQYKLQGSMIRNGMVLVEIRKGMYGLPQAGIIANNRLQAHLKDHGYLPTAHTPGLFKHATRDITFSLVVDDFGIKYVDKADADHLLTSLQLIYQLTVDWTGTKYCGLALDWDYQNRTVDISMPGYIERALHKFQHDPPTRAQHSPHAWTAPAYGATIQYTAPDDHSTKLDSCNITRLQEIVGTLLYYARAVDSTLLVALGSIASAPSTEATAQAVTQLLNYCSSHPNATLRYSASDMILHVHSDASYLSEPKARSRAGGFFFLSKLPPNPTTAPKPTDIPPPINGAIHTLSSIMRVVLSSATEAEMGALFHNAKDAAWLRTTLIDLGHPQPPTPIQTDNACASGIINDEVKQRRSKAIDMRFYWVKDRVAQGQFIVHWRKGSDNLADYFTKHHSPSHHRLMRSRYLLELHRPPPAASSSCGEGALIRDKPQSLVATFNIGQQAGRAPNADAWIPVAKRQRTKSLAAKPTIDNSS